MKKPFFRVAMMGLAMGVGANVLAQPIASVTNTGTAKVLINTGQTTLDVPQGSSVPGSTGDIVTVLAPDGMAKVVFNDDCMVTLTDNQRLVLMDSGKTCSERIAAVQKIEAYQSEALGATGRTGTATTATAEASEPAWVGPVGTVTVLGIPYLVKELSDGDGGGGGGGGVTPNVPPGVQP